MEIQFKHFCKHNYSCTYFFKCVYSVKEWFRMKNILAKYELNVTNEKMQCQHYLFPAISIALVLINN